MRILIIGGYGYLGSYLTEQFNTPKNDIHILGRRKHHHLNHIPHYLYSKPKDLRGEFDLVLLAAGIANHKDPNYLTIAQELHLDLYSKVVKKHCSDKSQVILYSSFHAYGKYEGEITIDSPTEPTNNYGSVLFQTEIILEQLRSEINFSLQIIRLSNGFGCPHNLNSSQWQLASLSFARQACENQEIIINSNSLTQRDYIFLGDVAKFSEETAANNTDGSILLSSGESRTLLELASICADEYENKFRGKVKITELVDRREAAFSIHGNTDYESSQTFEDHYREECVKIWDLLA